MKEMKALIYPVSFVPVNIVKLLEPLFDKIELLLPSDLNLDKIKMLLESVQDRVKFIYPPNPDQQDNYNNIIKDFKTWASQIGLGLGTTAAAIYESIQAGGPQEIQAITDAIKGRSEGDPLVEARAFLEFALEYDLEQEELERELKSLSKKAEDIEVLMAGPEKELDGQAYGAAPQQLEPFYRRITQPKRRLEAWYQLLHGCKDQIEGSVMPLGISIEVKDVIDKAYEAMMDKELPVEIARLNISAIPDLDTEKQANIKMRIGWIAEQLTSEPDDTLFKEIQQEAAELEKLLPPKDDRPCLSLTYYPNANWLDLFVKSTEHEKKDTDMILNVNWSFYLY